jgi:predicted SnoaL-like aldol condensation-catalyzing enzyme
MNATSKEIVTGFIEEIWNKNGFEKLDKYLHPAFSDHSLPPGLPPDKEGLTLWIMGTGQAFEHKTIIEEMVCEENKVMLKIRMLLKHIGTWRNIEPTSADISTVGYRYFKLADNKIIEHWALIDGNAIENQLKEVNHGCNIQK